ncbi:sigma-E factor regulatory protein RseB [Vibrio sp. SM6]|uniref:Sigma-E factor regulatory protein RseB n=1 Tax=Vibrio agarilyticus TaxID=2726741 RepID=A0A7X8TQA4_9VIBR|nr:sigma-E factor regulatory protein RseB [Vibrio agarilyticus]NLS12846.1 sigma-E factor regulatory protein RseB [Vibrio agarilyticus]
MNKILISVCALFSATAFNAFASEQPAEALLHEMSQASHELSYELSYMLIKQNSIEPLLYRHANRESKELAHLMYLSGPIREVIRRGREVSYIETGNEPFTIESGKMIAPMMPLLNADIDTLKQYYDYIQVGRAREAGAPSQVLRIVPKDGLRYSYIVWIDEGSKLPLRADLVDRDGEVLEQYRTVSYAVSPKIAELMSPLDNAELPQVLQLPAAEFAQSHWQVNWVPQGFVPNELNRYRLAVTEQMVESQLYSDGLFSFSVYVANKDSHSMKGQLIRQGRRTLHSVVKGGHEITVVGDIPPATAQRIAQSVSFKTPNTELAQP